MKKNWKFLLSILFCLILGTLPSIIFILMGDPIIKYGIFYFISLLAIVFAFFQIYYPKFLFEIVLMMIFGYYQLSIGYIYGNIGVKGIYSTIPIWSWIVPLMIIYHLIWTAPFFNMQFAIKINQYFKHHIKECLITIFAIGFLTSVVSFQILDFLGKPIKPISPSFMAIGVISSLSSLMYSQEIANKIIQNRKGGKK